MSANTKQNTSPAGWRRLLPMIAIVFAISFLFTVVSDFAAYPTEQHRQVRDEYNELLVAQPNDAMSQDDIDSRQLALSETAEDQYSTRVYAIAMIAGVVGFVVLTYLVYARIRRNKLAAKAVGATAVVMTVAAVLESLVGAVVYKGYESWESIAWLWVANAVIVLVVSFVIASLCESWYKRRNSFEI